MNVQFRAVARQELTDAFDWYEVNRAGMGVAFAAAVDSAVQRIKQYPLSGTRRSESARRMLVHKFPYAVWYSVEGDTIDIHAIAHTSREPEYWREQP